MNEVRLFGAVLAVMLVAAYLSWTRDDETVDTSKVVVWDMPLDQLERVALVTTTQTVTVSRFASKATTDAYAWFEIARGKKRTAFVGNDQAESLLKRFAPLEALRSLGRNLAPDDLAQTGLDAPKRKLTVTAKGTSRMFDVGKTTHGARDHYVRRQGDQEVLLLAARALADLEFPQSKFMQRSPVTKSLTEIGRARLAANGKTVSAVHQNRTNRADAFWRFADEEKPNEVLGNFLLNVSRLSIVEYPIDTSDFDKARPLLEVSWTDDDGKSLGTTALSRLGEGDKAKYFVRSDRTMRPAVVSRVAAQRLEQDLASLFP